MQQVLDDLDALTHDGLHGIEQISELVGNLRNFSRLDRSRIASFNVNDSVNAAFLIARPLLRKVDVEKRLGELPAITCSPSQVNQVVLNLVTNSVQAIDKPRGQIVATTRREGDRRRRHRDHGQRPRHPPREPHAHLRSLLHHQGAGQRHRARVVDRVQDRRRSTADASTCARSPARAAPSPWSCPSARRPSRWTRARPRRHRRRRRDEQHHAPAGQVRGPGRDRQGSARQGLSRHATSRRAMRWPSRSSGPTRSSRTPWRHSARSPSPSRACATRASRASSRCSRGTARSCSCGSSRRARASLRCCSTAAARSRRRAGTWRARCSRRSRTRTRRAWCIATSSRRT